MQTFLSHKAGPRRGMALLYTVFAVFAAATMVSMMMTVAFSASRMSKVKKHANQARYAAEGSVETAKKDIIDAIANFRAVPAAGNVVYTNPSGGQQLQVPYTAAPTGFAQVVTDPAGIQTLVTGYQIQATANINGHRQTLRRLMNAEATPIFQYAVFYTNDLEINPGPNMTLSGRVHTNANMYLNCGATLTVNTNYLRAVGDILRYRKDNPALSQGAVNIRKWVLNPYDPVEPAQYFQMNSISQMAALGVPGGTGYDSQFTTGYDANANGDYTDAGDWLPWGPGALAYWSEPSGYAGGSGNTVLDAAHAMTESSVPQIGSIAMWEPDSNGDWYFDAGSGEYQLAAVPGTGTHDMGYYHSQADLSILTMSDGTTVKAFDKNGTAVALPAACYKVIDFYDARQGGTIKVTEIDVKELSNHGLFPGNGLLYAAHYGAGTGTLAKGVKLKNGSELAGKLTVVSENSVYIHGDFNSVNKKGAAVIADAVNLLSKGWDDTKTAASGLPPATDTTYNVAVITGNQDSAAGTYNGGLENLPRFHENWSGKKCTITGSFVNTWLSKYATGGWLYGSNRYTAPNRIWNYDPTFNSVANLPPFTPMAVIANDVVSW